MAATVLIIANDKAATAALAEAFSNKREFSVVTAQSGRQALGLAKTRLPDAVLIDATSPRLNARRICRALRSETFAVIVALVANPSRADNLAGANLVLARSTTARKLAQRVRIALDDKPPRELRAGRMVLDVQKRTVTLGGKSHRLTPKEFELLRFLIKRKGEIVSRPALMKEIWNTDYLGDTRTLDVHIRWLREKIEERPSEPVLLITVRGEGYRLDVK